MSKPVAFLTLDLVKAVHRRMIAEFGGDVALHDEGLLESAAGMPAAQFGGEYLHDGVGAMAAAYLFHLCKNHPFADGNKRTALASAEVFIRLNGMRLDATNAQLEELTRGAADGSVAKKQVISFFNEHVVAEES